MEHQERRQNPRHSVIKLPEGELTLMYDDKPVDLFKFKNISPFGVCLLASEQAKKEDVIQIRYHHKTNQLDVYGTLIWQETDEEQEQSGYWLGIRFWPHNAEANIGLFELLIENLAKQKAS